MRRRVGMEESPLERQLEAAYIEKEELKMELASQTKVYPPAARVCAFLNGRIAAEFSPAARHTQEPEQRERV